MLSRSGIPNVTGGRIHERSREGPEHTAFGHFSSKMWYILMSLLLLATGV